MTAPGPSDASYTPAELQALRERGVRIPVPEQVAIGREVPLTAIAPGAELRPFSRLEGPETRVDAGAVIGVAGAATLRNSWVGADARIGTLGPVTLLGVTAGPGTALGCGVAEEAVFLGKEGPHPDFTTGYGFRLRKGSLYEEDASSAQHTDTKMTVLQPWVTLGSNLNFCDVLVSGGTGPGLGAFSEIGSGVIHFNFTPRGDKATGSLLGDVVRGVFLREARLFVGGNASLIGPLEAEHGAVCAAGGRHERALHAGLNLPGGPPETQQAQAFDLDVYGAVDRVYRSQVRLVGQLAALDAWYGHVRAALAAGDAQRAALYARGRAMVQLNLRERIGQLGQLARRMERSAGLLERRALGDARIAQQRALLQHWPRIEAHLGAWEQHLAPPPRELLAALETSAGRHGPAYTHVIRGLAEPAVMAGKAWLAGIAGAVAAQELLALVPPLARSG
jgi:UDP-N-acetylglucosamine/UDP-N-acetylgalactosamine diphosphorylase